MVARRICSLRTVHASSRVGDGRELTLNTCGGVLRCVNSEGLTEDTLRPDIDKFDTSVPSSDPYFSFFITVILSQVSAIGTTFPFAKRFIFNSA